MEDNTINNKMFDKDFRNKLRKNPKILYEMDSNYKDNVQVKIVTNTKNKIHVVFPSEQNIDLMTLQAGVKASTAGSVGSAGSLGTLSTEGCSSTGGSCIGCFSTLASASSIGSIGSLGSVDV